MFTTTIRRWLKAGTVELGTWITNNGRHAARRYSHSLNAKDNFAFDRGIRLDRGACILDLRRKR